MSTRKTYSPEQKVAIVRRHLLENVPVSDLCDEYGIHATQQEDRTRGQDRQCVPWQCVPCGMGHHRLICGYWTW